LQDSNRPLFNRVVAGEFPAGSTIKPVMAAAALEEKIINENTTINSNGGIRISEWIFPDWKAGGHGLTNVKKALAESVNTFFYYIGGGYDNFKGLGIDKIVKYFKLFWLGQPTGIDLPSEGTGFVPTPAWKEEAKDEVWYIGDTYHVSIGQGDVSVTPLQVANYTAFFANGGKLYKPHLVKQVLDSQNQVIKDMPTEVLATGFVSPQNIEIVRAGLRQTVLSGSARSLNSLSVPIAGKTGTAQWSTRHQPQAWFTGFAPYDNPQIVVTILVEEGGEGSAAATPIAKEIFDWYFKNRLNK
jgi:penicillin-binding protein 2